MLSMDRICEKLGTWQGLRYVPTTIKGVKKHRRRGREKGNLLKTHFALTVMPVTPPESAKYYADERFRGLLPSKR